MENHEILSVATGFPYLSESDLTNCENVPLVPIRISELGKYDISEHEATDAILNKWGIVCALDSDNFWTELESYVEDALWQQLVLLNG